MDLKEVSIIPQVNFLVVLYGLFNGLVLLPVLLSWFGPEPHSKPADSGQSTERNESVKTEPTSVIGGALANRNVAVSTGSDSLMISRNNLSTKVKHISPFRVV